VDPLLPITLPSASSTAKVLLFTSLQHTVETNAENSEQSNVTVLPENVCLALLRQATSKHNHLKNEQIN